MFIHYLKTIELDVTYQQYLTIKVMNFINFRLTKLDNNTVV